MYRLRVDALGLKDGFVIYGETKDEVIAKTLQYLEVHHSAFVGQTTLQRLAELQGLMLSNIQEE